MKLSVIIVDDEPKSIRLLEGYLKEFKTLEVVATAKDADEATTLIEKHKPDIVFLDIAMPGANGFDLLNKFKQRNFEVIFVTAYDEFALKAYEQNVLNYLLKPIDQQKLALVIERCVNFWLKGHTPHEEGKKKQDEGFKISIPDLNGHVLVDVEEIVRCEGDGNYTFIYTTEPRKYVISQNIKVMEEKLSNMLFFRVHKRHLINLKHVAAFSKGKGGFLTLSDGNHIPISFRKKGEFVQYLQKG